MVDASTLERKLLFGYQGWFQAPGDGSQFRNEWHHWSWDTGRRPNPTQVKVDNWPDMSELDPDELFPTDLRYPDGHVASVYSGYVSKTVLRHFRWMGEYGIDGVNIERFLQMPADPRATDFRNRTLQLAREGAERYGRIFFVNIDISSASNEGLAQAITDDWTYVVDSLRATESPRYARHKGRPVLGLWGFGFANRPGVPEDARMALNWLQRDAPERYRATVVGGIPWSWRTQSTEKTDPAWAPIYRRFDVIQPWHVGAVRSSDPVVEDWRRATIEPDLVEARAAGREYMPVVFPGFSWSNMARHTSLQAPQWNSYPRRGGAFWWKQMYEYLSAGCTLVKGAMFDEIDEGTAMYKLAATAADAPVEPRFVTLDADGVKLPSDWYLRVAGAGTRMLRGDIPRVPTLPISS